MLKGEGYKWFWGSFDVGHLSFSHTKRGTKGFYRYRADKSTIVGMRGLWGLTINSEGGAMFLHRKVIISASILVTN